MSERARINLYLLAYYLTIGISLLAHLFPEARFWGIDYWYGLALPEFSVIVTLAVLAPVALFYIFRAEVKIDDVLSNHFWPVTTIVTIGCVALFFALRSQFHLSGDGFTLLATYNSDNPILKIREIGESYAHFYVTEALRGAVDNPALWAFQGISILCGALFVMASLSFVRRMEVDGAAKWLLFFGLLSGGYCLLFFGYVENYSMLSLFVAIYLMSGVLALEGRIRVWIPVLAILLAVVSHSLAVAMLLSAVYLIFWYQYQSPRARQLVTKIRLPIVAIVIIAGAVLIYSAYQSNPGFRNAFLTLSENEFTSERYTLFSGKHILDFLNLLFQIFPGLLIGLFFVLVGSDSRWKPLYRNRIFLFLLLGSVTALGGLFLIDPKIGMPRDWDLFAFAFIAPTILMLIFITKLSSSRERNVALGLFVALSCTVLTTRVISNSSESTALKRFMAYVSLDREKNLPAMTVLQQYYVQRGDTAGIYEVKHLHDSLYPEVYLVSSGQEMINAGNYDSAMALCYRAIELNKLYHSAYVNIGQIYLRRNELDSAKKYVERAIAMRPYNERTNETMGILEYNLGNKREALKYWMKMYNFSKIHPMTLETARQIAHELGRTRDEEILLRTIVKRRDAPDYALPALRFLLTSEGRGDEIPFIDTVTVVP